MAGKGRFRIPTSSEMDYFDKNKPQIKSYFRQGVALQPTEPGSSTIDGPPKCDSATTVKTIHRESTTRTTPPANGTPTTSVKPTPLVAKPVSHKIPTETTSKTTSDSETASESKGVVLKDGPLQPLAKSSTKSNCVLVNPRQRGNPVLKHIRNIPWEFGDISGDYEMGHAACALYLSIRYHQLNPNYIHERLKKLGRSYDLRVMLVQIDIKDPHFALKELAKICILADCTLVLAFSPEEAGRYLETYKIYENKPPDAIMEKTENNFLAKFTDCLTTVKSVNKTDCMTVLTSLGSFEEISKASAEDLSLCPGFGPQKAQRLYNVLHEPFLKERKRKIDDDQTPNTSAPNSPRKTISPKKTPKTVTPEKSKRKGGKNK